MPPTNISMKFINRIGIIVLLIMGGLVCGFLPRASLAQTAPVPDAAAPSAFAQSLTLRMDRVVADSTHTAYGWLGQSATADYKSKGALKLKLALLTDEATPKPVKELGTFTVFGANLAANPFPFPVEFSGAPDGHYRCVAEVWDGDEKLAVLEKHIVLAAGLDAKQAEFSSRLEKITGHDSAKASILYPFDLARVINSGRRVYGSGTANPEFGLSQAGAPTLYDFSAGLKKSAALLDALEAGHDPVWRAGGELVRHYYMPEAGEILPYHVYVPATWDGKSSLPLVFILHGNSRDQDFYFERDDHIIPKAAEKHGFMLAAPLGYAPNAGYNYVPFNRTNTGPRGLAGASAAPQTFGSTSSATGLGGVNGSATPAMVRSEWSEQDAMHVFELIKQEYPIDPKRTYLFGYSAGGQGAHYIGQKYAQNWVAIAIGGSSAAPGANYDFDRLKNIPVMVYCGAADLPNVNPTRTMFQALQQHGITAVTKEYPGANHDQAPSAAVADVFDFFAAHPGK